MEDMHTDTTGRRISAALTALRALPQNPNEDDDDRITDLITNLAHLAETRAPGEGGETVLRRALMHFEAENEEEG